LAVAAWDALSWALTASAFASWARAIAGQITSINEAAIHVRDAFMRQSPNALGNFKSCT
jgi:hypothetical protein